MTLVAAGLVLCAAFVSIAFTLIAVWDRRNVRERAAYARGYAAAFEAAERHRIAILAIQYEHARAETEDEERLERWRAN